MSITQLLPPTQLLYISLELPVAYMTGTYMETQPMRYERTIHESTTSLQTLFVHHVLMINAK